MVDATSSYPAVWSERDEESVTGVVTVGRDAVRLDGGRRGRLVQRSIPYHELDQVRVGRDHGERLYGRAAIVVERRDAPPLLVRPLGLGLLTELAELLAELCAERTRVEQVAIVLPLNPDAIETARALVAEGPPFDPADTEMERHEVFLTGREAIFVFAGVNACETVRRYARDTAVWRAADRWAACLDGPPRLAEL